MTGGWQALRNTTRAASNFDFEETRAPGPPPARIRFRRRALMYRCRAPRPVHSAARPGSGSARVRFSACQGVDDLYLRRLPANTVFVALRGGEHAQVEDAGRGCA